MTVQFKIEGADNLRKNLKMLAGDVQLKTAWSAGKKAANVIRDAAKANASRIDDPESPNSIAKNIAIQRNTRRFKRTGDISFRIGVRGGAKSKESNEKNPGGDTFYWRFIELGTRKVSARPFMQPALRDNIANATNTFAREFDKGINRAIKRMKKK